MALAKTVPVTIKARPTRIALLVEPDDKVALSRWLRLTSVLWGGALNPVIPILDETPMAWQASAGTDDGLELSKAYFRFYEPDVLVEAKPGLAERLGVRANPTGYRWAHVIPLADFISEHGLFAAGLTAEYSYAARYKREAQFVLRDRLDWTIAQDDELGLAELFWGVFPDDPALASIEQTYRQAFKPLKVRASPDAWLDHYDGARASHMFSAFEGLEVRTSTLADARFFVFDPTNPLDRIDFWNARLHRASVLGVPIEWTPDLAPLMRKAAREGRQRSPGDFDTPPHGMAIEFSETISRERADALVATHFSGEGEAPMRLRHVEPELVRPFRTPFYPWPIVLSTLVNLLLLVAMAVEAPGPTLGFVGTVVAMSIVSVIQARMRAATAKAPAK